MTRVCSASILSPPASITSPGAIVAVRPSTSSASVTQHLRLGMALEHLPELGHVVPVVVGEQDVGKREVARLDRLQERLDGAAWSIITAVPPGSSATT